MGSKEKTEPAQIKIVPDSNLERKRVYSNFVNISHSPFDFTLTFCDAPAVTNVDTDVLD